MPDTSEASQEIKFWLEFENELKYIEDQLKNQKAGLNFIRI